MSFQAKSLTITNHQSTISQLTRDNKACGFTPVKEDDKQMKQTWTSQGKDQTFVCWPKQITKLRGRVIGLLKYTKAAFVLQMEIKKSLNIRIFFLTDVNV